MKAAGFIFRTKTDEECMREKIMELLKGRGRPVHIKDFQQWKMETAICTCALKKASIVFVRFLCRRILFTLVESFNLKIYFVVELLPQLDIAISVEAHQSV